MPENQCETSLGMTMHDDKPVFCVDSFHRIEMPHWTVERRARGRVMTWAAESSLHLTSLQQLLLYSGAEIRSGNLLM
jgi:hypothetical protein